MQALVVVDVQNEFSPRGRRPCPGFDAALAAVQRRVGEARRERRPIAWVRHHNRPHEFPGFEPGSWGAEFAPGIGPAPGYGPEREFVKEVYGPFTATDIGSWLTGVGADSLLLVGFYAHMCVSTTAREALCRDFDVAIDPGATASRDIEDPVLGFQSADEVRRSALLQLVNMGVRLAPGPTDGVSGERQAASASA